MKKKLLYGLILLAIIVGTTFYLTRENRSTNNQLTEVKVAQFGEFFLYMPLYIADHAGFFKEEGLSINITNTGGDDKTFAAVISGAADFGIADPTFVAIASEKGAKGKVIASIVNGVPFWGVTKDITIPIIDDITKLKGYSVATFPAPSTAYTLQYDMFEDAGLKPNIRQAGFGALLPMLEAGDVDIALELEPNVSQAVKNGAKIVYSMADMYGDFAITGVTISEKTANEDKEIVQKFVNALQKAQTFAHQNPDRAIAMANKIFPDLDDDIVENAMKRILDSKTFPDNVLISQGAWIKAISLREEVGDLKNIAKSKEILEMSFSEIAQKME